MPEHLSQLQPQARLGVPHYQRYVSLPKGSWGPLTTARIVTVLGRAFEIVWMGAHPQNNREMVVYAEAPERERVEVKFPLTALAQGGWLHVSSESEHEANTTFEAMLDVILETSKAVQEEVPF